MKRTLFLLAFLFVAACGPGNGNKKPAAEPAVASDEIYLTIDAGSMLGIIPLMLLEDIEKQTDKRTYQLVDGILGTSTGAIIGGLLTLPIIDEKPATAEDSIKFYKKAKTHAFNDKNFMPKVEKNSIKDPMINELNSTFKETTLSQAMSRLQIASYEKTPEHKGIYIFDSNEAKNNSALNVLGALAIRASTAIPKFFDEAQFNFDGMERTFVDLANGTDSVFIADPTKLIFDSLPKDKKVTVYSLGTGFSMDKDKEGNNTFELSMKEAGFTKTQNETYEKSTKEGGTIRVIRLNPNLMALRTKINEVFKGPDLNSKDIQLYISIAVDAFDLGPEVVQINAIDSIQAAGEALKSTPGYKAMLEDMKAKAKRVAQ